MENQQLIDQVDIASAANALARIVEKDWPEGQTKQLPVLLLRALCHLAVEDADRSRDGWETPEIARAMAALGAPWGELDENDARARVNDHWKSLIGLWDQRKASVQERLNGEGLRIEPIPEKLSTTGGRGKKARYSLQFLALPSQATITALSAGLERTDDSILVKDRGRVVALPKGGIHYYSVPLEVPAILREIDRIDYKDRLPPDDVMGRLVRLWSMLIASTVPGTLLLYFI